MAKAVEYVKKLQDGATAEDVAREFALETRELVELRTKKSNDQSKAAAAEGALREQRQKWDAVASKNTAVNADMFNTHILSFLDDVVAMIASAKAKPKVENEKPNNFGRTLV